MKHLSCFLLALATACASATPAPKIEGETPNAESEATPSRSAATPNAETAAPSNAEPHACSKLPFFDLYEKHGVLTRPAERTLAVQLRIDMHQIDCLAPDCFGHDMLLTLALGEESGRCIIATAEATSTPFDGCRDPEHVTKGTAWQNSFNVVGRPDLADRTLDRVELRDAARGHALMLLSETYFFYENVAPEKKLLPRIVDVEHPEECCGGYTSRATWEWTLPQNP
jgi:hypothetical protein